MKIFALGCTLFAAVLSASSAAALGPGSADKAFGENGAVTTGITSRAFAQGADGRLLVADGNAYEQYTSTGALERRVTVRATVPMQTIIGLPDGGVVLAGANTVEDHTELDAVRFDAAGTQVWSVTHRFAKPFDDEQMSFDGVSRVVSDPAGRLLVLGAGYEPHLGVERSAIARLRPADGTLDATFGTGGADVYGETGCTGSSRAVAATVASADSIIVAEAFTGCSFPAPYGQLFRVTANGRFDATLPLTSNYPAGRLVLGPGGSLLVNGVPIGGPATTSRFNASGTPDETFGEHGSATVPGQTKTAGGEYFPVAAAGLATDAAGRIVTGTATSIARLGPDGTPDRFDVHGIRSITKDAPFDVAWLPSGAIVAAVGGNGPVRLVGLRGGTAMGHVSVSAARLRHKTLRFTLRCQGEPGCSGAASAVTRRRRFVLADGQSVRLRFRLQTSRKRVRLQITNLPDAMIVRLVNSH